MVHLTHLLHPETLHLPFEEPFASEVGAMAIRKGDLDTLNFFNGWTAANEANGWLGQRCQYWFETRRVGRPSRDRS